MLSFVAVFIGGGLGSLCRYGLSLLLPTDIFPWATLIANVLACFLLGFFMKFFFENQLTNPIKLFLGTGFCGGFSTFSTFSKDLLELEQLSMSWVALAYLALSLFLGIMAVYAGILLAIELKALFY